MKSISKKDKDDLQVKSLRRKFLLLFAAALLAIYIIGLVNPITGSQLQYPYYELFCGNKPIVASSFMSRSYYTPDMQSYDLMSRTDNAKLYCTEEEARAAGYR